MKISVTFKNPDALDLAIENACVEENLLSALSESDDSGSQHTTRDEIKHKLSKWVEYNEYVTVVFDTDAGTAEVKENAP